jgi:hypothetical protein
MVKPMRAIRPLGSGIDGLGRARCPIGYAAVLLLWVLLCLQFSAGEGAAAAASDTTGRAPAVPGLRLEPLPSIHLLEARIGFTPEALALDGLGRLFALDRSRGTILRITPDGRAVPFGVGDQGGARFPNLTSLFARWGPDLFALDPSAGVLYQFDLDGHLKKSLSYGERPERADLGFVQPSDFGLTRSGELLLLDRAGGRLLQFDRFGEFVTDLAAGLSSENRPQSPTRLAQAEDGEVYVMDPPGVRVRSFSRLGAPGPSWSYGRGLKEDLTRDPLLCVTPQGQVVVAGRDGSFIRFFDREGLLLLHWSNPEPARGPLADLVASPDSVLYGSWPGQGCILRWRWFESEHGGAKAR